MYYPLTLAGAARDELRHFLLRYGIDTKITDMSDCSRLKAFSDSGSTPQTADNPQEASLLEICVYPILSQKDIQRIGELIRTWAAVSH